MACVPGIQIDITGAVKLTLKPLRTTARRIHVLLQLRRHVVALAAEMEELRDVKADIEADVHRDPPATTTKRMLSNQARRWTETVDSLDAQVRELESSLAGERSGLGGLSWAKYRLSRRATRLRRRARELQEKGKRFGTFRATSAVTVVDAVEAVPSTWTSVVGGERALSEVRQHLADDSVGIVGVYGMGGVGKTTLLTRLNNELLLAAGSSHGFDVVIWVTASRDDAAGVPRIQMDMLDRLGVAARFVEGLEGADQGDLRAKVLFRVLSDRRFLLLLDDLWEKLDWTKLGVPFPSPRNGCKVVFTTRSREVCAAMDAQRKVKVDVLSEAEAWDLFRDKVGGADLESPPVGKLARRLAAKCGGLPLALITVGRAMADATAVGEWEEALEVLSEAPEKLPGMEEEVLKLLKFSFDRLKDETARECLLYCCLFPEDQEIPAERLVEFWIGEGLLDTPRSDGLDRARNRALGVIRRLKAACLLESGGGGGAGGGEDDGSSVKLHGVVREMAIWMTGGEYDPTNTFLADAGKGLSRLPRIHRWAEARKVSLLGNTIEDLPGELCLCAHLSTLFLNLNPLRALPGGFLVSMPSLRVLDMSGTDITELPREIGSLGRLQHLNLSGTRIESLPAEMAALSTLRQLDLRETYELSRVPRAAIAALTALQSLNLRESGYCPEMETRREAADMVSLGDLEDASLRRLEELGLDILHSSEALERLINSRGLSSCTRFLRLRAPDTAAGHLHAAFEKLVNLRELHIGPCSPALEELRLDVAAGRLSRLEVLELNGLGAARFVVPAAPNWPPDFFLERLRSLCIIHCHGFRDLTWVKHLPCLQSMQLAGCNGVEQLIRSMDDEGGERRRTGTVEEEEEMVPVDGGGGRTAGSDAGNGGGGGGGGEVTPLRKLKFMSLIGLPALRSISREPLLFPSLEKLHVCQCPKLTRLAMEGPCSAKEIREIVGESEWWSGLEWEDTSSIRDTLQPHFRPSTEL